MTDGSGALLDGSENDGFVLGVLNISECSNKSAATCGIWQNDQQTRKAVAITNKHLSHYLCLI